MLGACGGKKSIEEGAVESYRSDFRSPAELKNWKCSDGGQWEIREGWLVCDARQTSAGRSILWLNQPLVTDLEIEFEAECLGRPGEIICFLAGDGQTYSGYEVVIGGGGNKKITVYRSTQDGDEKVRDRLDRGTFKTDKDRVYAIKIKKRRGSVRVYVNDQLLVTALDAQPVADANHRYFGFSTVGNLVRFDNLKIERKL